MVTKHSISIFFQWLIIIYCSGYYYSTTAQGSSITLYALILGIIICFIGLNTTIKVSFQELFFLFLFVFAIVLSELASGLFISFLGLKQVLTLILAFLLVKILSWEDFQLYFSRIMIIVAGFAVVGQLILFSPFAHRLPLVFNYNDEIYVSGVLFSIIKYQYLGISSRMQGLFWEPGLFATYLFFAIIFTKEETFKKRRHYLLVLTLFIICIIMSRSGAGLLLLPLSLIVKLSGKEIIGLKRSGFLLIIIILIVFLISPNQIDDYLDRYLYSKLFDIENISTGTRLASAIVDLNIFANNFMFGVGPSRYATVLSSYAQNINGLGLSTSGTSTLTTYLAEYGVFGFSFVYTWIKGLFDFGRDNNMLYRFSFAAGIIIILFKEPHGTLLFMNCIFMFLMTKRVKDCH